MNDPTWPPSMVGSPRTDFDDFEDEPEDDLITLSLPSHVVITAEPGVLQLQGYTASVSIGVASLTEAPSTVEAHGVVSGPEKPADLLWTPIAHLLMSPTKYRAEWLPHIADMHFERAECIKRGDKRGATWAVVRAHYYSVPRWVWAILLRPCCGHCCTGWGLSSGMGPCADDRQTLCAYATVSHRARTINSRIITQNPAHDLMAWTPLLGAASVVPKWKCRATT